MLDTQVRIYMLDTGHLYTDKEKELHVYNAKVRSKRRFYVALQEEIKRICNEEYGVDEKTFKDYWKDKISYDGQWEEDPKLFVITQRDENGKSEKIEEWLTFSEFLVRYQEYEDEIIYLREQAKISKAQLLEEIENRDTTTLRRVRSEDITNDDEIATFESELTRVIGAEPDKLCTDIFTLQVYYYGVFKDAMLNGVMWNGEKYVYFTSSAGMIRKKRGVFIKESLWKEKQGTLTCGLTIDDINAKGGMNTNKYLSYLALTNSATDVWEDFEIDRCIVVPDYEAPVRGEADFIDDLDYSITRKEDDFIINHIDGAGMVLPGYYPKTTMIRLPWIKGLIHPFSYDRFIKEKNCSPVIKDIWGKEHHIFEEDIQVIFSSSQMKLGKFYNSWEDYKDRFKKNGCHACLTNEEEEFIPNATINYQMLQQLVDFTDDELEKLVSRSANKIKNVCKNINTIREVMGVNRVDEDQTPLQKCFKIYPPLLKDRYTKDTLRDLKDSLIKQARAGKLAVNGKYSFALPDFYAVCERWFLGIERPHGLLRDGEVFCKLYKNAPELVCLRSPSLFHETPVRVNMACYNGDEEHDTRVDEINRWFEGKGVYASVNDLITRILQEDFDGDHDLLVADKTFVEVCKRNMEGIVPLYYEAKKAKVTEINPQTIYEGLSAAFSSTKIGLYSNSISKVWNSSVFTDGTEEEKQEALDTIKRLCMESNLSIDSAKTQYIVQRPLISGLDKKGKEVEVDWFTPIVSKYTGMKLPAFFEYAKDKKPSQVEERNGTFVNRIYDLIPNPRIDLRHIEFNEEFDFHKMMKNPRITCAREVSDLYDKEVSEYKYKVDSPCEYEKTRSKNLREVDKFRQLGYSDEMIADMLVEYTFGHGKRYKQLLWFCYGNIIYRNLYNNLYPEGKHSKVVQCKDCNEYIEVDIKDNYTCRCFTCREKHKKKLAKMRKREQRKKK